MKQHVFKYLTGESIALVKRGYLINISAQNIHFSFVYFFIFFVEKQEKYKYLFGVKRDLTVASILDEIQKPDELFIYSVSSSVHMTHQSFYSKTILVFTVTCIFMEK